MRYEFSEHGWTAIKPMLPNKPRALIGQVAAACSCHRLGPAFGCAMARFAGDLWSPHNLLQSFRSV